MGLFRIKKNVEPEEYAEPVKDSDFDKIIPASELPSKSKLRHLTKEDVIKKLNETIELVVEIDDPLFVYEQTGDLSLEDVKEIGNLYENKGYKIHITNAISDHHNYEIVLDW